MIATKNEEANLPACLNALRNFDQIIVHDSCSADDTEKIANQYNALYIPFSWNGQYPKKRQYFLDNHANDIKHDWVFFVDADEIITPALCKELQTLFQTAPPINHCAYFIKGQYVWNGKNLRYGMQNKKIALFSRHHMEFPIIDDLDIKAMGEIEGHYQPVKKANAKHLKIGHINAPLMHNAYANKQAWQARHKRYAAWEDAMDKRRAWPDEDSYIRSALKRLFKSCPPYLKSVIAFIHCYIYCRGFLDGRVGFNFALSRASYYWR